MPVNERLTGNLTVDGTVTQGGVAVQNALSLTTTGTSGAATLVGSTLNIPQYSGGGGGLQGIHAIVPLSSNQLTSCCAYGSSFATTSIFTNRLYFTPFIPNQSFTSLSLIINVVTGTASALSKILIYSDLNGVPDTKLYESAELDCSTAGIKTALTTFNFVAGTTYWLAITCNISYTMSFINTASLMPIRLTVTPPNNTMHYTYNSTYPTTPTTIPSVTSQSGAAPFIGIYKA